jgi:hypothetical protein
MKKGTSITATTRKCLIWITVASFVLIPMVYYGISVINYSEHVHDFSYMIPHTRFFATDIFWFFPGALLAWIFAKLKGANNLKSFEFAMLGGLAMQFWFVLCAWIAENPIVELVKMLS